jgi:cysteine desulfurase/selenocysteine lyase
MKVNVRELGCDFLVFSGHKLYGPMGVGVLYGKRALLDRLPPWQGGGGMIEKVTFEATTWAQPPARFEAGTPPVAEAVALAAAVGYLEGLGMDRIRAHEDALLAVATERLRGIADSGSSAPRRARPPCSPSSSMTSTPTTSAPSSTGAASRCARDITAPSR